MTREYATDFTLAILFIMPMITRYLTIISLCWIASVQSSSAEDVKPKVWTQIAIVHPNIGKFKFVERFDNNLGQYVLSIYSAKGKLVQKTVLDSTLSPGYNHAIVSIYDVDGDGYMDIVTNDGYGAGPFASTSLFRFNKDVKLFERDERFQGYNFPVPAPTAGCVYLEERVSPVDGNMITEWCLGSDRHEWKAVKRCMSSTDRECYEQLDKYQFNWFREQRTSG